MQVYLSTLNDILRFAEIPWYDWVLKVGHMQFHPVKYNFTFRN